MIAGEIPQISMHSARGTDRPIAVDEGFAGASSCQLGAYAVGGLPQSVSPGQRRRHARTG